jgi:hypothetical protein
MTIAILKPFRLLSFLVATLTISFGLALAVAAPAQAADFSVRIATFNGAQPTPSRSIVRLQEANGIPIRNSNAPIADFKNDFVVTVAPIGGSPVPRTDFDLAPLDANGEIKLTFTSPFNAGDTIAIAYQRNANGKRIQVVNGATVSDLSSFSGLSYQLPVPPSFSGTPTVTSAGSLVSAIGATASTGSSLTNTWMICTTAKNATTTSSDAGLGQPDCHRLYSTENFMDALTGTQLDTAGSYFELVGYRFQPAVFTSKQISFLQIAYDPATGLTTYTFSASIPFNRVQTTLPTSAEVAATSESAKPLPDWFAPLLNAFVATDKNVGVAGGKLTLSNGNFSGLKTVTVAGLAVLFTLDSKGSVNIPVPAGKVGTADLALTFDSGSMNIQDAIKYVAPIDVATVPVREISIAAGSAKITELVAGQIRQAAFANVRNNAVQCVGYATNGSVAAKAAARATATRICSLTNRANPSLRVTNVTIVVNKTKARKAGVGIKVYKADN